MGPKLGPRTDLVHFKLKERHLVATYFRSPKISLTLTHRVSLPTLV